MTKMKKNGEKKLKNGKKWKIERENTKLKKSKKLKKNIFLIISY